MARRDGPTLFDLDEPEAPASPSTLPPVAEPAPPGDRIIYRDRNGKDWPGRIALQLGPLVTIEFDPPGLDGIIRRARVDPTTIRPERT